MTIDTKELDKAAREYKPQFRKWTPEETAVLVQYYGKVPVTLLARKLNRTVTSLQNKIKDGATGAP